MFIVTGYAWNKRVNVNEAQGDVPEFDDTVLKEIHAIAGQTIVLPCTVRNLGDKVVSTCECVLKSEDELAFQVLNYY